MKISENIKKELLKYSKSVSLKKDMQKIAINKHNPFLKDGMIDSDVYIEFVSQFNEFINHTPRPFKPLQEKDMKL